VTFYEEGAEVGRYYMKEVPRWGDILRRRCRGGVIFYEGGAEVG